MTSMDPLRLLMPNRYWKVSLYWVWVCAEGMQRKHQKAFQNTHILPHKDIHTPLPWNLLSTTIAFQVNVLELEPRHWGHRIIRMLWGCHQLMPNLRETFLSQQCPLLHCKFNASCSYAVLIINVCVKTSPFRRVCVFEKENKCQVGPTQSNISSRQTYKHSLVQSKTNTLERKDYKGYKVIVDGKRRTKL